MKDDQRTTYGRVFQTDDLKYLLSFFLLTPIILEPMVSSADTRKYMQPLSRSLRATRIATKALIKNPRNARMTLKKARDVVGKRLSLKQKIAVLAAHNIHPRTPGKKISYRAIKDKSAYLKPVFKTKDIRKRLMDKNIVGMWNANVTYNPQTNKYYYGGKQTQPHWVQQEIAKRYGVDPRNVQINIIRSTNQSDGYTTLPRSR